MTVVLHRLACLSTPALVAVSLLPLAAAVLGGVAIHTHRTRRTHL